MSRREDGFDRLKAMNPVDESDVDGPDSVHAQVLMAQIAASPRETQVAARTTWRPMRLAIVLAAFVFATGAAWMWTRIVETPNAVSCYQSVDLDADVAAAPAGGEATADACTPVWAEGILVNPAIVPTGEVPPLAACVSENGSLAVFPTEDATVCSRLGLAYPEPMGQGDANELRAVEERIISYFQSEECISIPQATTQVRAILDESSLARWTIQVTPETLDRTCASHSFDADSQTIYLIPIPGS